MGWPRPSRVPPSRGYEVASEQPGVRVFVVESEERRAYERGEREKAMGRVQPQLEALAGGWQGGSKTPEKIGAAAQRVLARHHGSRYYDWKLEEGQFEYFEHPLTCDRSRVKYLIQVEGCAVSPRSGRSTRNSLSPTQRCHRFIIRRTGASTPALAFLDPQGAGLDLSSREAWQILRTVRVVEIDLGGGKCHLGYPRKWPGRTDPSTSRSQSRSGEKAGSRRRLVTLRKLDLLFSIG